MMMTNEETLYDLCEQTAVAIETHPHNYFQGAWYEDAKHIFGEEACGTSYCRAGWMVALAEPAGMKHSSMGIAIKAETMFKKAGISEGEIDILFKSYAIQNCGGAPGSEAYVKAGADGMRAFMAKHEDKLKKVRMSDLRTKDGHLMIGHL